MFTTHNKMNEVCVNYLQSIKSTEKYIFEDQKEK